MNPGTIVFWFMLLFLSASCCRAQVLQDSSLVPLLDVFGLKSTVELMEEVFSPNSRLGGKSPWQRRGSR